jgi:predicted nuclease of predicted toxin-antitoxin system
MIRFHLDENVSNAIAIGLRRQGIDVTTTAEQSMLSVSDEEQLAFARSQGRVIFTQDDDFLSLHQLGVNHAGIAYCKQGTRTIGEIINYLFLMDKVFEAVDMQKRVEFI